MHFESAYQPVENMHFDMHSDQTRFQSEYLYAVHYVLLLCISKCILQYALKSKYDRGAYYVHIFILHIKVHIATCINRTS